MTVAHADARLHVLQSTQLLDSAPERAFDRLTRLASGLIGAPVALVSLVDDRRQFFKSALGLTDPWASRRQTPLSHSFCQYVTRDRAPLVVDDARESALLKDNLAIRDLGVIAYAGIPLMIANEAIGSFCVIDDKPRAWTPAEIQLLTDLAESVVAEIELRLAVRAERTERALLDALLESAGDAVLAVDAERSIIVANEALRRLFPTLVPGTRLPAETPIGPQALRSDGSPLELDEWPLRRALRGETTDGMTFAVGNPTRWLEASGRPIRDTSTSAIGAVAVFRDVTATREQSELYRTVAANIPNGAVILFDREQRCLAIDGHAFRLGASATRDLRGKKLRELAGPEGDERFDAVADACQRTIEGEAVTLDFQLGERVFAVHTNPVRDSLGNVRLGLILAQDVTHERALSREIRHREQIQKAILQHLPQAAVLVVDHELRYVAAQGPALGTVIRQARVSDIVGMTVPAVASDQNRAAIVELYASALRGERRHVEMEREGRYYDLDTIPIYDGTAISHAMLFLYDVTERKKEVLELERARAVTENHAAELQQASITDELTGLHNRRGFMVLAEQSIRAATRTKTPMALVFIDLNGMKVINDKQGHEMGDRALVATATLLRSVFRGSDVIARLGGDEFVVLASAATESSIPAFHLRLKDALLQFNVAGPPFRLSLSMGASFFDPASPSTIEKLLSEADKRMYADKARRDSVRMRI